MTEPLHSSEQILNQEHLEKQTPLNKAKRLIQQFRQKIEGSSVGNSKEDVNKVVSESLSDFAISESEKLQTDGQKYLTTEAFIASDVEGVDDDLIGTEDDPIKAQVESGNIAHIVEGVAALSDSGELEIAELIAHDADLVEAEMQHNFGETIANRELLLIEASTAKVYMNNGETASELDLKKMKNSKEAWVEERRIWHDQELSLAQEAAKDLSEKLGDPPRIIAMRGGCGSGKSFAVKSLYGDRGIFDDQGDVPGAVKPDYFKTRIKQHERESPPPPGMEVTSEQVHLESTGMNSMFMHELAEDPAASLLIDKQLESAGDIPELIELGKATGKSVELLDNDVPIELSAYRVLKREVGGTDPNIKFDGVANGFKGIRANRESVYQAVNTEDVVGVYSLRAFDPESKQQIEIATKQDGKITVKEGYDELARDIIFQTEGDALQEIQETGAQVITEEYVESFANKYFDTSDRGQQGANEARKILGAYIGLDMTVEQAMHSKADGIEADSSGKQFTPAYKEKLAAWKTQQMEQR
jgi:hypothetical protein